MIHDFERRVPANLILPVLALCAGITVAGVIFYRHQAAETQRSAEASLTSIANLKASQIAGWVKERKSDANVAAGNMRLLRFLRAPDDQAAREATSKYCDSLRRAYDYEAVAILDAQGSPLLVSPPDGLKAHSCATALVLAAAQTNDVVMADLHRGPSEEKVHLSFLHSIVDASGTNAAAVGVVLLVVDPYRYLYPLLQSWPVPSQTAESLLIRHEGNEVVYLNELRHRKGAPLSLRIADSRTDVAGVRAAVLGERGIIRGKDYRGIPITSVGCGVPETPWILGAKIDMAEVDASLNQGAWMIGSIIFLLDVAVILGVFGLWRENWLNFLRRASEKKYKVLFESSRDAIMTLAPPTWCFTSANPATIAMFGVRDEAEFRSFNQAELSPGFQPDGQKSSEKAHAMIAKAMNDGANFFEWTHQRVNGQTFPATVLLTRVEISGQQFLQATIRDITEQKNAEKAQTDSRDKYQALVETTGDFVWEMDTRGIYTYCSPQMKTLWGYEPDEMVGKSPLDVMPPETRAQATELLKTLVEKHEPFSRMEIPSFDSKGNLITIETSGVPFFDTHGRLLGYRGITRDITERKRAEDAPLAAEEAKFMSLLEGSSDGVVICDFETHAIHRGNGTICRMLGYSIDELMKLRLEDVHPAEELPRILDLFAKNIRGEEIGIPDLPMKRKDGSVFYASLSPLTINIGGVRYVAGFFHDATHRRNAERALREGEEFIRIILDSVDSSICVLDEHGNITAVNQPWRRFSEANAPFPGAPVDNCGVGWNYLDVCEKAALESDTIAQRVYDGIKDVIAGCRTLFHIEYPCDYGSQKNWFSMKVTRLGLGQKGVVVAHTDVTERKHAERQLAADFAAMMRLNKLGSLFLREGNLEALLTEVVDTAIEISGADFGNVQLLDPSTGDLHIVTQKGFPKWWLDFWNSVSHGKGVCGTALERGERVIVDDVEHSPIFIGTPALEIQLKAGVRAVQSTPLISRSGKLVGMFSTHFKTVRRPDENAMRLLDLLARQAADLIEHAQSELALGESEMKFRTLFERMAQGVVYQGRDGAIISANAAAERILGLTLDQMKRRTSVDPEWHSIHEDGSSFSGEDHPAMISLSTGRVVSDVVMGVFNPRDHLMRWISITAVPEFLPGEEMPHRVFTTFDDITERRRAAEKLRLSEAQFKGIFQGSADGIVLADPATKKFKLCNEGMSRMSGYSLEDLGSMSVDDLHPTKELPFVIAEFEKLLRGEIKVSHEIPIQRKDGSILHADITTALIPIDGVVCLAGFFRDVTERRTARLNLEHRLNYEHVLSRVTQMTNEEDDIEALQQKCVDMLGQALDVSRVYICAHCEEDNTTSNTFEWVAPGITGQKHNFQNVPSDLSPWCFNEMLAGRPISVEDIELLPDEKLKTLLRAQNSISLLAVPIFVSGRYFGFMGFDECRHRRAWPEEDAELLRTLVRSIGDAHERHIAAEKLRLSEERFRTIFEGSPEGILLVDPSSKKFKYSNETMCRMLGYSMAEIVTLGLDDVVPLDQLPRTIAEFERQLRGESKLTRDITFTRKDGSLLHVDVTSSAITIEGATCLAGFMSDISARVQSERFSNIQLELATALSSCHDLKTGLRHCMEAAIQAAGCDSGGVYLVDDRTGALDMLVHQGLSDEFVRSVAHFERSAPQTLMVVTGKSVFAPHSEIGIVLQPEQQREKLSFLAVIPMHLQGRIIGCINIASHVLKDLPAAMRQGLEIVADSASSAVVRLQAEAALHQSSQRLQMALRDARMGVWEYEFATQKLYWSSEIFDNLGIPFMEPTRERMLELLHPEDINVTQDAMDKAIRERSLYHCEYRVIINGRTLWIEDRARVIRDANDKPVKAVGTARDITERRNAEDELRNAIARTDHLNSLLLSIHDVQNLIVGAGGKQELLEAVCDSMVKTRGYVSVWFGELQNEPKRVLQIAHAGAAKRFMQHAPIMWDDSPLGGGPTGLAIREKRPVVFDDLATDPRFEPWRGPLVGGGAASIASVPLIRDGEVRGVLTVKANRVAGFDSEEVRLLQTLVANLGGALERLEKAAALRDSHSLLTATQESTADGILVVDNTGKVVRFNQRFLTLWHIPRLLADAGNDTQLLQFVLDQLIEPQAFVAKVQELYQNPHASSWDEITFHDGRVFERYSQPQQIGDTVVGRVWSFRDVSERKRDQATLEEREKRLNAILKTAQDAFWFLDIDGRIKDVNDAACQLYGYTREEMLQLAVADFDATETKKEIITRIENITRLHSDRFEVRHRCKDGRVIDVEISANFIDLNGAHLVIFIRDITRRKKTEADVQRLAMVVEQAAEMVMITDVKGALQYVNPSFEKVTGHSKSDVLGKNPNLLSSGKHDGTFFKQMWESILRGDVWHGRVVNKRKDGTLIEQDVVVSPVRDTGGTITNFVAAMRDVTREQQLEQQVQQSQKMEAIGRLAGGVAHDFNNILTATLMCLDMLKDDPRVDDSLSGELQELTKQANRAAALTRQLLMFSRRSIMQTATLDFNEVLTNVLKMLRRILGEDINIGLQLKNDLPLIEADGGMMEQIIMNLSVNARDAMPKGGRLTFATSVANFSEANLGGHADRRAGRFVTFSISDTGTGMDEKTMEKIFEPFFTTKGIGKGTGLGLATVYGICQQHRGWIEVTSEIGKGSTFRVYLPAKTATPDGKQAAGERKPLAGGSETLLLVEDEADVRKLTAAFLRRLGYVVLEASTGAEALDIWETASEKIALLYTDMVMPGEISGRDLARILCEARPGLPVMISSGYSAELTTEGAIAADEIVFVPKPCPPKDIAALVRKCLDAQR